MYDVAFDLMLIEYLMTGCPVRPLSVSPLFERTHELSPWLRVPPPTARRKQQHNKRLPFTFLAYHCLLVFKIVIGFLQGQG